MAPQPGLFVVLDKVVSNLRATTGYTTPTGATGIPVYDGPLVGSGDNPATYVCIGWTPDAEIVGSLTTAGAVFGPRADRREDGTFDVTCSTASGDGDASTLRAILRPVIRDLTAAVYGLTDASFDGGYWCEVQSFDLRQFFGSSGVTVEAVITFAYRLQQGA